MGIYEITEGLQIEKITDKRKMSIEVDEVEYGSLAPEGWISPAYSLMRDGKEVGMLIHQQDGELNDGWWVALNTGLDGEVTRRGGHQYVFVRIAEDEASEFLNKAKNKGIYEERCDWCGEYQNEFGNDVCESCGEEL